MSRETLKDTLLKSGVKPISIEREVKTAIKLYGPFVPILAKWLYPPLLTPTQQKARIPLSVQALIYMIKAYRHFRPLQNS